jgi:hypothetical protein
MWVEAEVYSRITTTKSPSFCTTTLSASLTYLTALLPQSHGCSSYVSGRIPAPPPLWLPKHTDLRAHDFAHSPYVWHQPRLANVTCVWSWRLCGINSAIASLILNLDIDEYEWSTSRPDRFTSGKQSLVLMSRGGGIGWVTEPVKIMERIEPRIVQLVA